MTPGWLSKQPLVVEERYAGKHGHDVFVVMYDYQHQLPRIQGHIKFENVSFRYTEEKNILSNINVEIQPGKTMAIVGRTASGKSTLANLLMP